MASLSSNFSTFLTLLTTQLKNQDPTSPMDSNQFTQQLVEFSQVEQQINTNTQSADPDHPGQRPGPAPSPRLIWAKNVSVTNGNASLSNGQANWTYNLGTTASSTQLTVTNAAGTVVYDGPGATSAGSNSFSWNGADNNGNTGARRHLHAGGRRPGVGRLEDHHLGRQCRHCSARST